MKEVTRSDGRKIEVFDEKCCPICSKPLYSNKYNHCWECKKLLDSGVIPLIKTYSVGPYVIGGSGWRRYALSTEIWKLKETGDRELAERIGECMVYKARSCPEIGKMDVVVPIPPGNPIRQFNHMEYVARYIAKELGITYLDILYIKEHRLPQHQASYSQKEFNIKGNIGCRERVDGKKILIVDDTYTTGNTMKECARALIDNGAEDVLGLVAVRAIDEKHLSRVLSNKEE